MNFPMMQAVKGRDDQQDMRIEEPATCFTIVYSVLYKIDTHKYGHGDMI